MVRARRSHGGVGYVTVAVAAWSRVLVAERRSSDISFDTLRRCLIVAFSGSTSAVAEMGRKATQH
jgi:hypothetical protein